MKWGAVVLLGLGGVAIGVALLFVKRGPQTMTIAGIDMAGGNLRSGDRVILEGVAREPGGFIQKTLRLGSDAYAYFPVSDAFGEMDVWYLPSGSIQPPPSRSRVRVHATIALADGARRPDGLLARLLIADRVEVLAPPPVERDVGTEPPTAAPPPAPSPGPAPTGEPAPPATLVVAPAERFAPRVLATLGEADDPATAEWSPDGARVAYLRQVDGGKCVVVNGQPGPTFDSVGRNLSFSADGSRFGYIATKGREMFPVLDGTPVEVRGQVQALELSPAGTRLGFFESVYDADTRGYGSWLVLDGKRTGPYESNFMNSVDFSGDSRRVAVRAGSDGQRLLIVDGVELGRFRGIPFLTFAPNSMQLAYTTFQDRVMHACVGERRLGPYETVTPITFSPDGYFAFGARRDGRTFLVLDERCPAAATGTERPTSALPTNVVLARSGRTWAFTEESEASAWVLFGDRSTRSRAGIETAWPVALMADGQRLAVRCRIGDQWYVALDRPPVVPDDEWLDLDLGDPYDAVGTALWVSPDGRRIGFGARQGRVLMWAVREIG